MSANDCPTKSCASFVQIPNDNLRNPNLEIAQLKFSLTTPEHTNDEELKKRLFDYITTDDMAPYYENVCQSLNWSLSQTALNLMKEQNENALKRYDDQIEYALENDGPVEIKQAYLNKANYLSRIGDKDGALEMLSEAYQHTVSLGYKLDNIFHRIRIALFFMDLNLVKTYLEDADKLIEKGGDWHSVNCFNILKAIYSIAMRDFNTATTLLINCISTFVCIELISLEDFCKYTVLSAMLTLNRSDLKDKIITNPDLQQILYSNKELKEYLMSLYECDYQAFFKRLSDIEKMVKSDMFLNPHYKYYVREMKTKSYNQLLTSYSSLKITYMADRFGVTPEYIEDEVGKLIAYGKLNYKIDKISGTMINTPKNKKAEVFAQIIKQGDMLINKVQKLGRITDV